MKITSLHQLDYGPYPSAHRLALTPVTMSQLTEYSQSALEGFFGAPRTVVGDLVFYYDENMSWRDLGDAYQEAIIPLQWDRRWLVQPKVDESDKVLDQILDAYNDLKNRHYWRDWDFRDEDGVPFKTLDRYAQRLGYMANTRCLIGSDRGGELDVLHITKLDRLYETTDLYHTVAPYWEGNHFTIHVTLESPFKGEEGFNEMLGYVVGRDQYLLDTAKEMVTDAIVQITNRKDR